MRRRDLVLAAPAAAVLVRPAAALAQAAREAEALTNLLRVEHTAVFAHDHVLSAGTLDRLRERLARRLRDHEAAHAEALAKALSDMRWPLPTPPRALAEVQIPQIRSALDGGDGAAALREVARLSEHVYRLGIARLREGRHIQLAATILAAEASHLVAWGAVG